MEEINIINIFLNTFFFEHLKILFVIQNRGILDNQPNSISKIIFFGQISYIKCNKDISYIIIGGISFLLKQVVAHYQIRSFKEC